MVWRKILFDTEKKLFKLIDEKKTIRIQLLLNQYS